MTRKDALRAARKSQAAQHAGLVMLKEQNKILEKIFRSAIEALKSQGELLQSYAEENDTLRASIGAKDDALKECAAFFQQRGYSLRSPVFKKLSAALEHL